ncbi:MAG: TetR/AcrR family transcriptional regulator [Actinomycetota bacterium]
MPRLWNQTIEAHRRDVRAAIMDTTAALIVERGLLAVTMSDIAQESGIGRATLYKYFPDVESILRAWHERRMAAHLDELIRARDAAADPSAKLEAVLETYALLVHGSHGYRDPELVSFLHRDPQVARAEHRLRQIVRDLIAAATEAGRVRDDVASGELAAFCVQALAAARDARTRAAARRLVRVTMDALRPER